ncbi:arsenate reductase (thioredoxin) [Furfurilactobacillus curtus]|uniref:Arsenate reductase (Thioredoxin) n=1 Tax=Furfurilactobacillus curtus TaxID=1746200 RepID=A0ABQ5JN52_9LACO
MPQVYFLCTGNSCRSQMAEGFAHQYLPKWRVDSAGIEVHGLNPRAVQVMAERDIDISHAVSKRIDLAYLQQCDLVVTLCGDARDRCPRLPASVKHEHWDFIDPAQATGTDDQIMAIFRNVRDGIDQRVRQLASHETAI